MESNGFSGQTNTELYITACYLIVQTITTVGYGEIGFTTTSERMLGIITMIIGGWAFTFATSSLSSLISNQDTRSAQYREKLAILKTIKHDYHLDDALFEQLQAYVHFSSVQRDETRATFINELPERLRLELCSILFKDYRKTIHFFKEVKKDAYFISWLCPQLKPLQVIEGAYIQMELDKLTHVSFIKSGEGSYVLPNYKNREYVKITEGEHFGLMDIAFRLASAQSKQDEKDRKRERRRQKRLEEGMDCDASSSESDHEFEALTEQVYCKFTIMAKSTCFLLQISKKALLEMKDEFEDIFLDWITNEF